MNIEVKVQGPDDELHLSDLESSITSTQGKSGFDTVSPWMHKNNADTYH